jgi:DNA-binding NarL/FixJ family response regulator
VRCDLIASSNADVAAVLVLSPTVRNYASNIFTKLHIADRVQAIVRVPESGPWTEA